jgi:hypothetical protein
MPPHIWVGGMSRWHSRLLGLTASADHPQYLGTGAGVFASGKYYNGNIISASVSSIYSSVANRLDAQTFFVRDTTSFDRISLNTSTINPGAITRLGIYKGDGTNYTPSTLLLDAGQFTGTGGTSEIVINQELTPGLYYLARLTDAVISWTATGANSSFALLGAGSVSAHYNASSIFTVSGQNPSNPLPDPFGTATGRVGQFTVCMRAV